MKNVVIVESPAKAKTINKYLGSSYVVTSSMGHVRDLPQSKLGIDVENGFKPEYTVIKGRKKVVDTLKKLAAEADAVFLAPDPDREGEAIAWHIQEIIKAKGKGKELYRVTFNEITEKAVKEAFEHPRHIDLKKVESQQARRVLDRLVGYKISPVLWKKIGTGLSAGRVQSVALKIICEREKEIGAFVPQEYWTISARLATARAEEFTAELVSLNQQKPQLSSKEQAQQALERLKTASFKVASITDSIKDRKPPLPFITSSLQQTASQALKWPVAKIMKVAQELYEGVQIAPDHIAGLITYMRTDSTRVSDDAAAQAVDLVARLYGKDYCGSLKPRAKKKANVQDAHECIRPTFFDLAPESVKDALNSDQHKLYSLIWDRFLQSFMAPARSSVRSVDIEAGEGVFRAVCTKLVFPGFLKIRLDSEDANGQTQALPPLKESEQLKLLELVPGQHFTKPPARYSEATLVKALEEEGVGRPSTYASIIQTLYYREYAEKKDGKFMPTQLGLIVYELLDGKFPKIMDIKFTAQVEKELDEIEQGRDTLAGTIARFYADFDKQLQAAWEEVKNSRRIEIPTSYKCEKCSSFMVEKMGPRGKYLACSAYPACRNIKSVPTGYVCPQPGCGADIIKKRSKAGKTFYGCSNYPKCTFTTAYLKTLKKPNEDQSESRG